MMEFCGDCRTETYVVESDGDTICSWCGLVLHSGLDCKQTPTRKRKRCGSEDSDYWSESDSESDESYSEFYLESEYAFDDLEYFSSVFTARAKKKLSGPRRYCSGLGMINIDMEAVEETIENFKELEFIKRRPEAIEAGVVYMIGQLCSDKLTIEDVSKASEVEKGEIEETYEDLYHFASIMIPHWYRKLRDIKKLRAPQA